MGEPVQLMATEAVKEFQDRIRARGIEIPDQVDWEAEDRRIEAEAAAERAALRTAAWTASVPEDFVDADLDSCLALLPTEQDANGHTAADRLRVWIETGCRDNVALHGATGTGKTTLAYALGHAIHRKGMSPYAVTSPDLLDSMRPDGDPRVEARALAADVLIVDDFGVDKATEWTAEAWWRITNHRFAEHKATILTTNETGAALLDKYGKRVISRLFTGRTLMVQTAGEDLRKTLA